MEDGYFLLAMYFPEITKRLHTAILDQQIGVAMG